MPAIYFQPSSRRAFLTQAVRAVGAVALVSARTFPTTAADERVFRLALLSDTHIATDPKAENRKFLPAENLKKVVSQVLESPTAGVIVNGDLARLTGEPADYDAFKQIVQPLSERLPLYLGLGKLQESRSHLELTLSIDPADVRAHNNLGLALLELGNSEDAVPHFRYALRNGTPVDQEAARKNLARAGAGLP